VAANDNNDDNDDDDKIHEMLKNDLDWRWSGDN